MHPFSDKEEIQPSEYYRYKKNPKQNRYDIPFPIHEDQHSVQSK